MKQTPKRVLSLVMSLCLIITMFTGFVMPPTQSVTSFPDLSKSHWAYDYIMKLADLQVVQGDNYGKFRPESRVTTAEFMAILNRLMNLTATSFSSYADVNPADWYVAKDPVFAKAAAQGYLVVEYGNKVLPNAALTREKAFYLIGRYLGLDPLYNASYFSDTSSISSTYLGTVNAVASLKIIDGYTGADAGKLKPQAYITRAEACKILYCMIGGNVVTGYQTVTINPVNKSLISAAVTKSDATIYSSRLNTVYITEGCDNGFVTISNSTITNLIIRASNCTVNLTGDSSVSSIDSYSAGTSVVYGAYTNFDTVTLGVNTASQNAVILNNTASAGTINTYVKTKIINNTGDAAKVGKINIINSSGVELASGVFSTVNISAANAALTLGNDVTVDAINVAVGANNVTITGPNAKINRIFTAAAGTTVAGYVTYYDAGSGSILINGVTYVGKGYVNENTGFTNGYPYIHSVTNGSTATIAVQTSVTGTLYYAIYRNDQYPTAEEIKDGTGAAAHTSYTIGSVNKEYYPTITSSYVGSSGYKLVAVMYGSSGLLRPVQANHNWYTGKSYVFVTYTPTGVSNISGFSANYPYISYIYGNTANVILKTEYTGTVYLAVYPIDKDPTPEEIKTNANNPWSSNRVAKEIKSTAAVYDESITIPPSNRSSYKIVAFLETSSRSYTPVESMSLTDFGPNYPFQFYDYNDFSETTGFYSGYPNVYTVDTSTNPDTLILRVRPVYTGRVYVAVYPSNSIPSAFDIINHTGATYDNSEDVSANVEKDINVSVPDDRSNYHVFAVLVAGANTYLPVRSEIVSGRILTTYTEGIPTAVLTADGYTSTAFTVNSKLYLTFSETMYYKTGETTKLPLSYYSTDTLEDLFFVEYLNGTTWIPLHDTLYDVAATNNSKTVVVNSTEANRWDVYTNWRVRVSESVVDNDDNTVASPYTYPFTVNTSLTPIITVTVNTTYNDDAAVNNGSSAVTYYYEAGANKGTFSLTKAQETEADFYMSNAASATPPATTAYTKLTNLTNIPIPAAGTWYFYTKTAAGVISPIATLTVVEVAVPTVTLNPLSIWTKDSTATIAGTIPIGATLKLSAYVNDTFKDSKTTSAPKVYYFDGTYLLTSKPSSVNLTGNDQVKFVPQVIVDGVVVAEGDAQIVSSGLVLTGQYPPTLLINGTVNGKWCSASSIEVRPHVNLPSGYTLTITTLDAGQPSEYMKEYVLLSNRTFTVKPTNQPLYSGPDEVAFTATVKDANDAEVGKAVYTIKEYYTAPAISAPILDISGLGTGADNNKWVKGTYAHMTNAPVINPSEYQFMASLYIDDILTRQFKFIDPQTKLYVNKEKKIVTTEPAAGDALKDGSTVKIVVSVVPFGSEYIIVSSNEVGATTPTE